MKMILIIPKGEIMKKENDNCKECDSCGDSDKWEEKFEKEFTSKCEKKFENWGKGDKWHSHSGGFMGGGFYFLGFVSAAIYYIQNSDTFWMGALGLIKALIWPAMLIYKVFTMLNM